MQGRGRKDCRHTQEVSHYFSFFKLNLVISESYKWKILKEIQILRPVVLANSVAKMPGLGTQIRAFLGIKEQFQKKIQILRPVAESVAKMLRGRGREDGRHTQVLLDILMRTDSSSNWGCIGRASPRHANTYLLLLLYEMSLVVYLKMNHLWNFVFWMFKLDYERTSVSQNQTIR